MGLSEPMASSGARDIGEPPQFTRNDIRFLLWVSGAAYLSSFMISA
jgi:hypothetical protein